MTIQGGESVVRFIREKLPTNDNTAITPCILPQPNGRDACGPDHFFPQHPVPFGHIAHFPRPCGKITTAIATVSSKKGFPHFHRHTRGQRRKPQDIDFRDLRVGKTYLKIKDSFNKLKKFRITHEILCFPPISSLLPVEMWKVHFGGNSLKMQRLSFHSLVETRGSTPLSTLTPPASRALLCRGKCGRITCAFSVHTFCANLGTESRSI